MLIPIFDIASLRSSRTLNGSFVNEGGVPSFQFEFGPGELIVYGFQGRDATTDDNEEVFDAEKRRKNQWLFG